MTDTKTSRHRGQLLSTKGAAWGPRRVELGISILELSQKTGIQKADLSRIETGRMTPTWEEYVKVAEVLGLPGSRTSPSVPGAPPNGASAAPLT